MSVILAISHSDLQIPASTVSKPVSVERSNLTSQTVETPSCTDRSASAHTHTHMYEGIALQAAVFVLNEHHIPTTERRNTQDHLSVQSHTHTDEFQPVSETERERERGFILQRILYTQDAPVTHTQQERVHHLRSVWFTLSHTHSLWLLTE